MYRVKVEGIMRREGQQEIGVVGMGGWKEGGRERVQGRMERGGRGWGLEGGREGEGRGKDGGRRERMVERGQGKDGRRRESPGRVGEKLEGGRG